MPITDQQALQRVIEHREIFYDEMVSLMRRIMTGEMSPVIMAALISGLRVKKETVGEIAAAAEVMREMATIVPVADPSQIVDIVGTGGDGLHTFNVSSAASFVAAASGAKVAKHGGRSVSSSSGSADAMKLLGVDLGLNPEQVAMCIDQIGLGFMFAPNHHAAMKHAAPVRQELGVRTLFNILGPLTNPAQAQNQLIGVFHPDLVGILVRVLLRLGSKRAIVVHGLDGLDELSPSAPSFVGELIDGKIREYEFSPHSLGIAPFALTELRVDNAEKSVAMLRLALAGENPQAAAITALNAGAALFVAGVAADITEGFELAQASISAGKAIAKVDELADFCRQINAGGRSG